MPTAAAAYSNRAAAYLKLKQYKEAEVDCTKALEIDPLYKKVTFLDGQDPKTVTLLRFLVSPKVLHQPFCLYFCSRLRA